jgi:hypothetical protein
MRCRHCGHRPDQHGDEGCHVRVLTGWDETVGWFTGERPCGCTEYTEPFNTDKSDCTHEKVKDNPRCVHCGRVVAENMM